MEFCDFRFPLPDKIGIVATDSVSGGFDTIRGAIYIVMADCSTRQDFAFRILPTQVRLLLVHPTVALWRLMEARPRKFRFHFLEIIE
jgi:hypothetical protein